MIDQELELLQEIKRRSPWAGGYKAKISACGIEADVLGWWALYQDFDEWVERTRTPETAVAELRRLFDTAPSEIRSTLALNSRDPRSLSVPCALIRGRSLSGGY